jgi:hypothetical protein
MDSLQWAADLLEDIILVCKLEITVNVDLWITIDGQLSLPTVINQLCPDNCSDNGNCDNGEWKKRVLRQNGV